METSDADAISPAELLKRVAAVVRERAAAGSAAPLPQALSPADPVLAWQVYPWRKPERSLPPGKPTGLSFAVGDLLSVDDEYFVIRCHHALLIRDPTASESEVWARRLREGWPRLLALGAIRCSREGRERSTRVRGLVMALIRAFAAFPLYRLGALFHRT
jgi:hypothetical protein